MALHPAIPTSPYEVLEPAQRFFPADEALRESSYEMLLPPLVARIREERQVWRAAGYPGAGATSQALLGWWFQTEHRTDDASGTLTDFRYDFGQREAVQKQRMPAAPTTTPKASAP